MYPCALWCETDLDAPSCSEASSGATWTPPLDAHLDASSHAPLDEAQASEP